MSAALPPEKDSLGLRFLYETLPGRFVLRAAVSRGVSKAAGRLLETRASAALIPGFLRRHGIDPEEFEDADYRCFDECFTRRVRPERRPLPEDPRVLTAPCDGRLSAYRVRRGSVFPVKQSRYTVADLLGGDPVARRYEEGVCLVFRLRVNDYHRYCYVDGGTKGENVFLPGRLHTVRPIALRRTPVFAENCREYTVMDTDHFGIVTQVEVGAMLVGRIENHDGPGPMVRGAEKGMFHYGGSTVVLLLEKDRATLPDSLFADTDRGWETPVLMGQAIGRAAE